MKLLKLLSENMGRIHFMQETRNTFNKNHSKLYPLYISFTESSNSQFLSQTVN